VNRAALLAVAAAMAFTTPSHAANRLAHEQSRYLLQHAGNEIDWYPWGSAALETARREHKLIFLSIGYSTCHWCQVLERESFSDPQIARRLNEHYVAILVDREERPDVDRTYIAAARNLMTDPGWPLNLILTPDAKPLFAVSYVPNQRLGAMLDRAAALWAEQPSAMTARAQLALAAAQPPTAGDEHLDAETLARAYRELAARYDSANGGFLPAPKFPSAHSILFLLRHWRRTGDRKALEMAETTLRRMHEGAVYDHVGFGFHRYAVDADWGRPHYEKLLCDQALTSIAYLEAFQATGKASYAGIAREIFTYVLRDLRAPSGAFYSAQDSDGAYYTARDRHALPAPQRDEKIIADWNGLMIAALAAGSAVLDEPAYARAAQRAADFILGALRTPDGGLLHQKGRGGYLDDSAFFTWGLLNLYEATGELRDLTAAMELQDDAIPRFAGDDGRFFFTAAGADRLPLQPRETADAALPSGNSAEIMDLLRLARMTMNSRYERAAIRALRATAPAVASDPSASAFLMCALDFQLGPSLEIVLSGSDVHPLARAVFAGFVPNKVVLYRRSDRSPIVRIAPFTRGQKPLAGTATAYVCTNFACKLPTTDPKQVRALLSPATAVR